MPSYREDLLRPSLSRPTAVAAAPYSTQAAFLTAFFGGPAAATAIFTLNSWRLGRLTRDAAWIGISAFAYLGVMMFIASPGGAAIRPQLLSWLGSGFLTVLLRAVGLSVFLLAMLLHRHEQRGAEVFGLTRPNPWVVCIGLIVLGWGCDVALQRWLS